MISNSADSVSAGVESVDPEILEGEVLIKIEWAGVNFKDSMVTQPGNRVARRSPLIGGVDLAGTVIESPEHSIPAGSKVLAHGHDIGVAHHGGFAEFARVPLDWVVPLAEGFTTKAAMTYGTAGFTAMASIEALERSGLTPDRGPILVTGANGGVGSTAIALLADLGYDVVASTGRTEEQEFLKSLGANEVIGRDEIDDGSSRSLGSAKWAGAIDCVGGATLARIVRSLHYGAAVAASGLTGGTEFTSSVFPFIVRGVSLLGIDSVETPSPLRIDVWNRLAAMPTTDRIGEIVEREVALEDLPGVLATISSGHVRGRILVSPTAP